MLLLIESGVRFHTVQVRTLSTLAGRARTLSTLAGQARVLAGGWQGCAP